MSGTRRGLVGAVAASSALLGAAGWGALTDRDPDTVPPTTIAPPRATAPAAAPPRATPDLGARRAARDAEARAGRWTAHLTRAGLLRDAPGGRSIARVGRRTGYGARRVFAVAAFRAGWIGVRAHQQPNGKLAWLPEDAVRLQRTRTTLVADLSERELTLRVDGRVRHRAPIGIGRPGHETPVGRYGVTDRLRGGDGPGATYGCCVIPLTGRQPKLPPGWTGGSRLALHGTPAPGSVGREISAGCLRMRNQDIRALFADVPLGATLTVRA